MNFATLDVTPRPLAVYGIQAQDKIYDGTTAAIYSGTPNLDSSGILGSDTVGLTVGTLAVAFADKNAGIDKSLVATGISLTGADARNYEVVVGDTASITPRNLQVTATGADKVYDGSKAATVAFADDRIAGDDLGVVGTALFDTKDVGMGKTITVSGIGLTGADANNYGISTTVTASADITRRALAITATAQDKEYDGTVFDTLALVDDRVAGDVLTITPTATFGDKNAGVGKAVSASWTVTGADAGNYTFGTSANLIASITPKQIMADGARVYDASTAVSAADLALAGLVGADAVVLSGSGRMDDKNVGLGKTVKLKTLALTGADAGNYALTGATIDITPYILTVSGLTAQDKTYDGTTAAVASGSPVLTGSALPGDSVSILPTPAITVAFSDKNAGIDKSLVVAGGLITGADAGNYQVVVDGTATIHPRNLAISVAGVDKVYDGTTAATFTVNSDMIAGDDLIINPAGAFADKNVGQHKPVGVSLSVTGVDAANYVYTTSASTSASITPRTLTIAATAEDKIYDQTTVAMVSLTDDRIAGDVLNIAGTGTFSDKNAGVGKTVDVALTMSGADLRNYTYSSLLTTTAAITPRPITFSGLTVQDKTYDGTVAAQITGTFASVSGLLSGDDISIDTHATTATFADKNAGVDKAVTVSGATLSGADAGNYSVQDALGTATIFQKRLDVTGLTPSSKVYDGTTAASASGTPNVTAAFVAGDDVYLDVGHFAVSFADKNVGVDKPLFVTGNLLAGTDAINYLPVLNTTASITTRPLTITAAASDKIYDGTKSATVGLSSDQIAGDLLTLSGVGMFADKNAGIGKAVTISGLAVAGSDAGNYSFSTANLHATASIEPKPVSAQGSRVYDGSVAMYSGDFDLSGLIAGDSVHFGGSATLVDKNVGLNKAYTGSLALSGTDATNYVLNGLSYDVTPKAISVTGISAASKVYDGTTAALASGSPVLALGDVIAGDQVSADLSGLTVAFEDKNVGTAKHLVVSGSVLSGKDAMNYAATISDATADITPRQITITGVGADNKVYDGTTSANLVITGSPVLAGSIVTGDDVTVDLSKLLVAFADKNAGTGKSLVVSGASLSGVDAGNYLAVVENAKADIAQKALTVSGIVAADKVYDGTTLATVDSRNVALNGLVSGDKLAVAVTGAFSDKNAGMGKTVVLASNYSGADLGNYAITGQATTKADIMSRPLSILADNVVITSGDPLPNPLTYSVGAATANSGLIGGDAIGSVTVTEQNPIGGGVTPLTPSNALFQTGLAGNYAIAYKDGYLVELPVTPAIGQGDTGQTDVDFFIQANKEDIEHARLIFSQLETDLNRLSLHLGSSTQRGIDAVSQLDIERIRKLEPQLAQIVRGDSALVISMLRNQPVLIWNPDMLPLILNPASQTTE